jgi:hypothetical protein
LYEVLVPTMRANGKPIRTRHHRAWDEQIQKITGGLTILRPTVGKWISPDGELFRDRMIPVRIACTSSQLDEVIKRTLTHYPDERAIFICLISEEVRIVFREEVKK